MKSEGCRNYETKGLVIIILKKQNKTHSQQMFQHPPKPLQTQRCGHHSHEFSGRLRCKHPDCEQGSVIQMIQAKPALPCGTNNIPQCVCSFFQEFNSQMCQAITVQFKTHTFSSQRQHVELNLTWFVLKVIAKKNFSKKKMGKIIYHCKRGKFSLKLRLNVTNATLTCISI